MQFTRSNDNRKACAARSMAIRDGADKGKRTAFLRRPTPHGDQAAASISDTADIVLVQSGGHSLIAVLRRGFIERHR